MTTQVLTGLLLLVLPVACNGLYTLPAPAVVLVSATLADANPAVLALATATGLLAALVQFLGLVRWPLAIGLLITA